MLGALGLQIVAIEAAHKVKTRLSEGADSRFGADGGVLDACERLVDGQCARQMFGSHFLQ